MTEAPPRTAPDRRVVWKGTPARLRARPADAGHRPERRHLRGGRPPARGRTPPVNNPPPPAAAPPSEPADPPDARPRRGPGRRFGAAAGEPAPEDPPRPVGEDRDRAGTDRVAPTARRGRARRVLPGAVAALVAAVLAAAAPLAPRGPERDWGAEARAAAQRSILDRAPDPGDVRFAGVRVRRTGDDDERWVCGSVAVWGGDGTLGPHQDFWVTVARVPGTRAEVREVRANGFERDDFLDRTSARFRACFARGGTE